MCLKGITRLEGPLATIISAHKGGLGEKLIRHMQNLSKKWARNGFGGIEFMVISRTENPKGVYLKDTPSGSFSATFRMRIENNRETIIIPVPQRMVTMNRERGLAGNIFSVVYRGNHWKDRAGKVHINALD